MAGDRRRIEPALPAPPLEASARRELRAPPRAAREPDRAEGGAATSCDTFGRWDAVTGRSPSKMGAPAAIAAPGDAPQRGKYRRIVGFASFAAVALLVYTQLTIFVVPPIGALPDGGAAVILRLEGGRFIDSPDAMCARRDDGVSLLCRSGMMTAVHRSGAILFPIPYHDWLYLASTGGARYGR